METPKSMRKVKRQSTDKHAESDSDDSNHATPFHQTKPTNTSNADKARSNNLTTPSKPSKSKSVLATPPQTAQKYKQPALDFASSSSSSSIIEEEEEEEEDEEDEEDDLDSPSTPHKRTLPIDHDSLQTPKKKVRVMDMLHDMDKGAEEEEDISLTSPSLRSRGPTAKLVTSMGFQLSTNTRLLLMFACHFK
jgi:hypothetical protein